MEAILSLVYLVFFTWLVYKTPFFRNSGISPFVIAVYFICCILLGWGHLWFAWRNFPDHGDMWLFFSEGIKLKKLLLSDYAGFLTEMRVDVYEDGALTSGSYVVRIQYQFMSFFYMVLNLFSFNNNYVNIVLFGYLLLFGKFGLYRAAQRWTPKNHFGNLAFLILPGLLFWTGVVHKEGIVYLALGLFLYFFQKRWNAGLIWVVVSILLILLCRSYILGILVLGLMAGSFWTIAKASNRYILMITAGVAAFFLHCRFRDHVELMLDQVIRRKTEFESLNANTILPNIKLEPSVQSFIMQLPSAFRNGFLLPYPGQFNLLYSFFSLEIYMVLLALLGTLAIRKWNYLLVFSLVFGISGVLLSGYTVPFAGALVRYRSLYLPFLMYVGIEGWRGLTIIQALETRLVKLLNYNFFYISK